MKKLLITVLMLGFVLAPKAYAWDDHDKDHKKVVIVKETKVTVNKTTNNYSSTDVTNNSTTIDQTLRNQFGVKADAPKLVHLYNDWYLGTEGGKALNNTSASEGWFAFAKVTYYGTLFSFQKDQQ